MRIAIAAIATIATLSLAGIASADTVRGEYTGSYSRDINITRSGDTRDVRTVQFDWVRSDIAGPGVDPYIPSAFDSYCIELTQTVAPGTKYNFEVLSPIAGGLSTFQETMLERLWASFFPVIDSGLESASFQACVWEIIYDADSMDIASDDFIVNPPSGGVPALAQGWLDAVNDVGYAGPTQNLVVLHNSEIQDQITSVPAPATAALAMLGLGAVARRRRSRA